MDKSIYYIVGILLILSSCKKKEDKDPISDNTQQTTLNLSNLKAGQKAKYIRYESNCNSSSSDFKFLKDTLILEVLDENGQLYFQESYTPFSKSMDSTATFPQPVKYQVFRFKDFLLIPNRFESNLFYFYGNDTIWLNPSNKVPLHQEECILTHDDSHPFIGDDIGFFVHFDVGPIELENKTAVSCVPIIYDLDAYLIYDNNELLMSHTMHEDWGGSNNNLRGWVALQ